jgi:hypothetical protein
MPAIGMGSIRCGFSLWVSLMLDIRKHKLYNKAVIMIYKYME